MKPTLNKEILKQGEIQSFETKDKDDLRVAEIDVNPKGEFRIFFNGKFIWIGKTFTSLSKRFDSLCERWNLEIIENEL